MNSHWNWKGMCSAKFGNTSNENDKTFWKKSAGSITAKQTSHHFQPNVLTDHNAMDNCKNTFRQHNKWPHQPATSSMWQNTMVGVENSYQRNTTIFTSSDGIIHISLRHGVQIDVTVDNSFRLTSCDGQIVIALSNTGEESAIKHSNGMVSQIAKLVQIVANWQSQSQKKARYATMNGNSIVFTSNALVELEAFTLDQIGTKQSKREFTELPEDKTSYVFFGKSKHGPEFNDEAVQLIRKASIKRCTDDGTDVITINDFRIWQMKDGLVTVTRMSFPFKIRASPMNCSFTLSTSHIHCTASAQKSSHLFVRFQEQSMHYDGKKFVVRYNGNSAGFDENDFLFVY